MKKAQVKIPGTVIRFAFIAILCIVMTFLTRRRRTEAGFSHFEGVIENDSEQKHSQLIAELSDVDTSVAHWPDQSCTHGLFRRYYRQMGRLPTGGTWMDNDESNSSLTYKSDVCKVNYGVLPRHLMTECFAKAKLSSFLTIGDSNAEKHYNGIFRMLKRYSLSCHGSKEETLWGGFLPDRKYYTKGNEIYEKIVNIHYRFCHGCGAKNGNCTWRKTAVDKKENFTNDKEVTSTMETTTTGHLPLTMILETAVKVMVPFEDFNSALRGAQYEAETTPEFFFKLYLKDNYPDVILIFLPFNHVQDFSRAPADIQYFHALVKLYIPRTTKVFYIPAFSEFDEAKRSKAWRKRKPGALSGWQRMDKLNRIMYDVIKDDVMNASSGIYSFFDLVDMSRDKVYLCTDGVHMQPVWYDTVISYFWEVFCNSVYHDDF